MSDMSETFERHVRRAKTTAGSTAGSFAPRAGIEDDYSLTPEVCDDVEVPRPRMLYEYFDGGHTAEVYFDSNDPVRYLYLHPVGPDEYEGTVGSAPLNFVDGLATAPGCPVDAEDRQAWLDDHVHVINGFLRSRYGARLADGDAWSAQSVEFNLDLSADMNEDEALAAAYENTEVTTLVAEASSARGDQNMWTLLGEQTAAYDALVAAGQGADGWQRAARDTRSPK